jgi:hypothetical protein
MESHRCSRECRRHGCRGQNLSAIVQAAATECVPLYYLDQNQGGATDYEVTRPQAHAMKNAGRGRFINRGKAFQLSEMQPVRLNFICSKSTDSTASISPSEIYANVGITPNNGSPNEPPLRHIVVRAQQKIQAIGRRLEYTFDSKAQLAFGAPSWPVYKANAATV